MSEFRSRTSLTIALASALALSACGKSAPPPPAAAPPPAPAAAAPAPATPPPAAPAAAVQITSVTLGNALAGATVAAASTTFAPKDTIYAVVAANNTVANAPISARWTYQGGQLVKEEVGTLKDVGTASSEFHISKPDGFPAGSYALDIIVDGKSISTTPFTVK